MFSFVEEISLFLDALGSRVMW